MVALGKRERTGQHRKGEPAVLRKTVVLHNQDERDSGIFGVCSVS